LGSARTILSRDFVVDCKFVLVYILKAMKNTEKSEESTEANLRAQFERLLATHTNAMRVLFDGAAAVAAAVAAATAPPDENKLVAGDLVRCLTSGTPNWVGVVEQVTDEGEVLVRRLNWVPKTLGTPSEFKKITRAEGIALIFDSYKSVTS
jgi:hypothetical protein